ncbi:MAG: FAD-binding protein [Gammaproteobacteria bacterium]|nr:MAG: FAD-binding protein [Gammaproteobacteria bacterium]
MDYQALKTDVLILGSGGAGLFAALHAKKANPELDVTIAIKGLLGKCGCTRMVQGGYNVALSPGDSVERHFMDTIVGGKWLPQQAMAMRLCETAVIRVQELENELGCFFDRNEDGSLHHKAFAGQTFDRTVHKGDLTGIEIISRLMEQVRALPVQLMEEQRALALLPSRSGDCIAGVLMVDMRNGEFRLVRAKTVLMATGGGPTMYRYHTPSGDKSMDGLAMALDLGLSLRDMEMVQFHPTGLLAGRDTRMTGTVLEEGLRGAGGHLLDGAGKRFMLNYDAAGERATRDIVSRAIYAEMRAGRTTPNGGVFIAMSHLGADAVAQKFPGMVKRCADCGFDLAGGRVEVVPTAHYLMGGVVVEADTRSSLAGLYVAGEDAGGAHGANRLGGNGVANSTVFGGIAGDEMAAFAGKVETWADVDQERVDAAIDASLVPLRRDKADINSIRDRLLDVMWDGVGVLRDEAGMRRAQAQLAELKAELHDGGIGEHNRVFNLSWHDWLNLKSLLDVSEVIAAAGLSCENSRGAHYREDFPEVGSLEDSYFTVAGREGGSINVRRQAVDFSIVKPGESLIDD